MIKTALVEDFKTIYLWINNLLREYFRKIIAGSKTNSIKSLLEIAEQDVPNYHSKPMVRFGFKIVSQEALKFGQTLPGFMNPDFQQLSMNQHINYVYD